MIKIKFYHKILKVVCFGVTGCERVVNPIKIGCCHCRILAKTEGCTVLTSIVRIYPTMLWQKPLPSPQKMCYTNLILLFVYCAFVSCAN